jgi:HSP20 family protein
MTFAVECHMRGARHSAETQAAIRALRKPMRVEIRHTSSTLRYIADLPGVRWADLQVDVDGNRLVVSGRRRSRAIHAGEEVEVGELVYGSFERSFELPADVDLDPDHLSIDLTDGVLTITIPTITRA